MKKIEISRFWLYVMLSCIIVISYIHYSVLYNSFVDITAALTVLMTPGFSIPGDLYVWGQNFYGGLIPFLAQMLHLTYRFPPAMAVAVVHYAFLIGGFIALATFFKSKMYKLLLAMIWFLPAWHTTAFVTSVFGLQLSLIAIFIYFTQKFKRADLFTFQMLWLSLLLITIILAVWISDLSYISFSILLLLNLYKNKGLHGIKTYFEHVKGEQRIWIWVAVFFWMLFGVLFLWYAKAHAAKSFSLYAPLFASPIQGGVILVKSLVDLLLFKSGNAMESLYVWLVLFGVSWIFATSKLQPSTNENEGKRRLLLFYGLHALFILCVILLSGWAFSNGYDRRYFSIVSVSLWIALFFYLEISSTSTIMLRRSVVAFLVFVGAISGVVPSYFPNKIPPTIDRMAGFKTLGNFGLIATSENAYLASFSDPSHIKATPHDKEYVRNFNLALDALKQDRIYLIANDWMNEFPDTIVQFERILQRTGDPFQKAGFEMCRYQKIVKRRVFSTQEMKYQGKMVDDTNAYSLHTAMITPEFDKSKHFIFGPFIPLPKGNYTVVFRLMTSRDLAIDNVAVLDVSANYGKEVVASKTIRLCDFAKSHHFEEFEIPFVTDKDYNGVEFRIMFLGGVDLSFDRVLLLEKQN